MHYNVQILPGLHAWAFTRSDRVIEIDAPNPKAAAISLLGLRLEETGESSKLAVRVWKERTPRDRLRLFLLSLSRFGPAPRRTAGISVQANLFVAMAG